IRFAWGRAAIRSDQECSGMRKSGPRRRRLGTRTSTSSAWSEACSRASRWSREGRANPLEVLSGGERWVARSGVVVSRRSANAEASLYTETDEGGRFTVSGIVPGAGCNVVAYDYYNNKFKKTLKELPVGKAESLDLGDFVLDLPE